MSEKAIHSYVLWWRYSDGSGCEITRVYLHPDRAAEDYKLITDHDHSRTWHITEVPLIPHAAEHVVELMP